jgi:hypothetical protein
MHEDLYTQHYGKNLYMHEDMEYYPNKSLNFRRHA